MDIFKNPGRPQRIDELRHAISNAEQLLQLTSTEGTDASRALRERLEQCLAQAQAALRELQAHAPAPGDAPAPADSAGPMPAAGSEADAVPAAEPLGNVLVGHLRALGVCTALALSLVLGWVLLTAP